MVIYSHQVNGMTDFKLHSENSFPIAKKPQETSFFKETFESVHNNKSEMEDKISNTSSEIYDKKNIISDLKEEELSKDNEYLSKENHSENDRKKTISKSEVLSQDKNHINIVSNTTEHIQTAESGKKNLKKINKLISKVNTQLKNLKIQGDSDIKSIKQLSSILHNIEAILAFLTQNNHSATPNLSKEIQSISIQVKSFLSKVSHLSKGLNIHSVHLENFQNILKQLEETASFLEQGKSAVATTSLKENLNLNKDLKNSKKHDQLVSDIRGNTNGYTHSLQTTTDQKNESNHVSHKVNHNHKLSLHQNNPQSKSFGQGAQHSHKEQQNIVSQFSTLPNEQKQLSKKVSSSMHSLVQDKTALGKSIIKQLGQNLQAHIGKDYSQFTMQLHPEELGKVKVILEMKNDVIKAQIIVENAHVKDILKDRFDDMKSMLQSQGNNISEMNVQTQQEYQQQRGNYQSQRELFSEYQQHSQEMKINKYINIEKGTLSYEKTLDNIAHEQGSDNFFITI